LGGLEEQEGTAIGRSKTKKNLISAAAGRDRGDREERTGTTNVNSDSGYPNSGTNGKKRGFAREKAEMKKKKGGGVRRLTKTKDRGLQSKLGKSRYKKR